MAHSNLSRDLLDDDEVRRLLEACGDADAGLRDRALVALMVATGLRVSEALSTEPRDLDLRRRALRVHGVGGRKRMAWVHPDAVAPVRAWLAVRRRLQLDGPLFSRLDGQPLSSGYVRKNLQRLRRMADIEKRVYADGFRHVFAARAHQAKITPRSLQVQFGHDNVAATIAYLERIGLHRGFEEFDRAFA